MKKIFVLFILLLLFGCYNVPEGETVVVGKKVIEEEPIGLDELKDETEEKVEEKVEEKAEIEEVEINEFLPNRQAVSNLVYVNQKGVRFDEFWNFTIIYPKDVEKYEDRKFDVIMIKDNKAYGLCLPTPYGEKDLRYVICDGHGYNIRKQLYAKYYPITMHKWLELTKDAKWSTETRMIPVSKQTAKAKIYDVGDYRFLVDQNNIILKIEEEGKTILSTTEKVFHNFYTKKEEEQYYELVEQIVDEEVKGLITQKEKITPIEIIQFEAFPTERLDEKESFRIKILEFRLKNERNREIKGILDVKMDDTKLYSESILLRDDKLVFIEVDDDFEGTVEFKINFKNEDDIFGRTTYVITPEDIGKWPKLIKDKKLPWEN